MPHAPAICIITLGCPKNEVDSDRMAAAVESSAYRLVTDVENADVVVLNTCAFIQPATEESIAHAFELVAAWRPERAGRRVIVAGCLPSRYGSELEVAMPEADAFLAVAEEETVLSVIERLTGTPASPQTSSGRTIGAATSYLKVSEGCDRRCAYCTIPAIRGPFVSMPAEELLAEARLLVAGGARELILVGQDVARYGHGLEERTDLPALVRALDAIEGEFRIRLMYLQPDGVTDALLEAIAGSTRVCRYLDIPFQHASAPILRAMGRPGSGEDHLALIARVRAMLPDVTLRTTLMTGFPGEREADVRILLDFLEAASFDYAGVFAYSPEEGTRAAQLPGQVRRSVRASRAQRVRDRADEIGFTRAAARTGTVQRVLVCGQDEDGEWYGRTCGQAPEVDGVTVLEEAAQPHTFVDVEIVASAGYDLIGKTL